ncbi:MAG TPA: hypothetical protein VHL59_04610, partial [Thermoanaerobaculia bacterium]|nr:hypothetical protein [Thermoanaerobaculia bacterium]
MKAFAFAVIVLLATDAVAQSDTSALVEASKAAKSKRKTSSTKVITNADVKKSKSKLTEKPASKTPAAETKKEPGLVEKHEAERAARIAAEERLAAAQARVTQLEAELARIEKSYYEENDLDRRDRVITKQFDETKAKLEEARTELAAAGGAAGSQPDEVSST